MSDAKFHLVPRASILASGATDDFHHVAPDEVVLVEVEALEQARRERDEARALYDAECVRSQGLSADCGAACAEVERLKAEQVSWERAGVDALRDVVAENERLGGEVERLTRILAVYRSGSTGDMEREIARLRGLIAQAEWQGRYFTCVWCGDFRHNGHAPDCPAFSARGEVRR